MKKGEALKFEVLKAESKMKFYLIYTNQGTWDSTVSSFSGSEAWLCLVPSSGFYSPKFGIKFGATSLLLG